MNNNTDEKLCKSCKRVLPATFEYFHRDRKKEDGLFYKCKECRGTKFGIHAMNRVLKAKEGFMFCGKCKKELPLDHEHFYRSNSTKSGWGSWCKVCWGGSYGVHQINKTYRAKEGHKFCSKCEEELPFSEFQRNSTSYAGYDSKCKKCEAERMAEYYSRPEAKAKRAVYAKEYRKRYYSTQRGIIVNKRNIQKRRSRKNNTIYNYSLDTWKKTLEEFNHECAYCGKSGNLQQEHIIPLSKGGYYTKQNIIPACAFCNASKKDRDLMKWYPKQPYYSEKRLQKINKWARINKNNIQQLALF